MAKTDKEDFVLSDQAEKVLFVVGLVALAALAVCIYILQSQYQFFSGIGQTLGGK